MQVPQMQLIRFLTKLRADCRGTTTVEYGFLLLLIVIGLIFAVDGLGGENGSSRVEGHPQRGTALG